MKLIAPTFVVLSANVLAIVVVMTTVVVPFAGYTASDQHRVSLPTTAVTTSAAVSTSSTSSQTLAASSSATSSTETSTVQTTPASLTTTTSSSTTNSTTTTTTAVETTTTTTTVETTTIASSTTLALTTTSVTSTASSSSSATSATTTTSSSTSTTTTSMTGCQVVWALPEQQFQVGATISASVVAGCQGDAKWSISPGSSGTKHCTPGTPVTLFTVTAGSSSYPPGTYVVTASFDDGHGVRSSDSSTFTIVSGQSSAGLIFPVSLSLMAFAFLVLKKQGKGEDGT